MSGIKVIGEVGRYRESRACGEVRPRCCVQVAPLGPERLLRVFTHSLGNLRVGLQRRVFYRSDGTQIPKPDKSYFYQRSGMVAQKMTKFIEGTLLPISPQEFVDCYSGQKRAIYQKAAIEYEARGVRRRDARVRAFVKAEKLPFDPKVESTLIPRIIQPRFPIYNLAIGLYLKKLEKIVFDILSEIFTYKVVCKGLNALQRGHLMKDAFDQFHDPVAVLLDMSRFDASVSTTALKWEHEMYGRFYRKTGRKELDELLSWQLRTDGIAQAPDGTITYQVKGKRMSGDMNTSMGNCLLMCMMVYSYGVELDRYRLLNDGDDCVIVMEHSDLQLWEGFPDHSLKMGFISKIGVAHFIEEVEFCQCHPVLGPDGYVMVRNFPNCISKDLTTMVPIDHPNPYYNQLTMIGLQGLSLTSGTPCCQEFYSSLITPLRRTRRNKRMEDHPANRTGMWFWAQGMEPVVRPILPETRASYALAFGFNPDEQMVIEAEFRKFAPCYAPSVEQVIERPSLIPLLNFQ